MSVKERICVVEGCNTVGQHMGRYRKDGSTIRRKYCTKHHHERSAKNRGLTSANQWRNSFHPYKQHRKEYCENIDSRLGFKCTSTIVDYRWQLEVDHVNENRKDNRVENLQTLCVCCHRIKSKYYREKNEKALQLMQEYIDDKL